MTDERPAVRSPTLSLDGRRESATLADVLDRILDKGLVVAGDIKISVANVELLTVRIRLLVCSMDKAQEMGLDWWRHDPNLAGPGPTDGTVARLEERIAELEKRLEAAQKPTSRRVTKSRQD